MSAAPPLQPIRLGLLAAVRQFRSPLKFLLTFAPVSYAHLHYYAVHTFVWSTGGRQPVRYRWRAEVGRKRTRPWMRLVRPSDYLAVDLDRRMRHGGIRFVLEVQRPRDVDPARLRDCGRPLPRRVPWQAVGTLHLTSTVSTVDDPEEFSSVDRLLFSPAHLPVGVEPYPGDEIFTARLAAYPASHVYRTGPGSQPA